MNKPQIIVIVGPTASGKSVLAVEIAKRFNGEIVSADSRQVYRGMDIGTGKITKKETAGIPHHLLDVASPKRDFNVSHFKRRAEKKIKEIIARGHVPILVGGTGLYIDAIVKNLEFPKVKGNKNLRARLEREIKKYGLDYVFKKLVDLDPEAAYIVDPRNPRRVIRALEVALTSGRPFSAQRKIGEPLYDILEIGISVPPEKLKERITGRTRQMFEDGLVDEVSSLIKKYGSNCKPFDAIGYREVIDYLERKISLAKAVEQMKKNTWHYARRQMAWFKRNENIKWVKNYKGAELLLRDFL